MKNGQVLGPHKTQKSSGCSVAPNKQTRPYEQNHPETAPLFDSAVQEDLLGLVHSKALD